MSLNVLYIGPNQSEWADAHCPGSLAAARWARGLLNGLSKFCSVTALTHTYYYPWPKGNKIWSGRDDRLYPAGWDCEVVAYPVLRYVREWWWRMGYSRLARRILQEKSIDVVIVYNCYEKWMVAVLQSIRYAHPHVKIIPVVLDGSDPRKDDWNWMKRAAAFANAFVVLSWWMYRNVCKNVGKPAYHLDGGACGWQGVLPKAAGTGMRTLVHTGELDKWRGLDFMIEVIEQTLARRKDVKFVFCGRVGIDAIRERFGDSPNVELLGFVEEDRLREICRGAAVLLNVRDVSQPDNILNYPSKLAQYLSFGRPVVSVRLQSLSPDYDEVVNFAPKHSGTGSAKDFVDAVESVLAWDEKRLMSEYLKIKAWFEVRKSWDIQARGLIKWMEATV